MGWKVSEGVFDEDESEVVVVEEDLRPVNLSQIDILADVLREPGGGVGGLGP